MERSKVLFVDDELPVLDSLKRLLRNESFEQIFTTSPEEALTILADRNIDVLVSDLLMADMNGLVLLEKVKEISPRTVRIVLSGHAQIPMILSAINRGEVFRFITKPWRVNQEAKDLILQALEYAELLKHRGNFCFEEKDAVNLVESADTPVVLCGPSGSVLAASPSSRHIGNNGKKIHENGTGPFLIWE